MHTTIMKPDMDVARPGWVMPEARDVTVKGHRIRYWEKGEGRPLVLVHGFGGSAVFEWGRVVEALSKDFRVIAPQVIGFAPADQPEGMVYSTDALTEHLGAFFEALDLKDIVLVGESFGGWLVASYAWRLALGAALPPISKLIVVCGALGRFTTPSPTARGFVSDAVIAEMMPMIDAKTNGQNDKTRLAIIRDSGLGKAEMDEAAMAKIAVPTLLIWGDQDDLIPLANGEAAARIISGAKLVVFENVGHIPSVECPNEFVRVVGGFAKG